MTFISGGNYVSTAKVAAFGLNLRERVAIVTGGAGGIGTDICVSLAANGASVVVADLNNDLGQEVVKKVEEIGGKAVFVKVDVSKEEQVKEMVASTLGEYGRLDIIVNNAAINSQTPIELISEEEWDRVLGVNLKGVFFCCREAAKAMKNKNWGRIINLGSSAGKVGGPNSGAHYCASKAAVMCLTKNFARLLGPYGITVNAVAPGIIETDMTAGWPAEAKEKYIAVTPKGRVGMPSDVAYVVNFLASELADYITGEIIDINGGYLMD